MTGIRRKTIKAAAANSTGGESPAGEPAESPLISNETLRQLFAAMVRRRALSERLRGMAELDGVFPGFEAGGEAVVAAMLIGLRSGDTIALAEDDVTLQQMKGAPLKKVVRRIFEKAGKGLALKQGEDANGLNWMRLKPGDAKALRKLEETARSYRKKKKRKPVAVVYAGGPAPPAWLELLRVAGVQRLPIVFVSQEISQSAVGAAPDPTTPMDGLPCIFVDRSDVVAIYRVAQESLGRARRGQGATLVVCGNAFSESGSDTDRDPLVAMEKHLVAKRLITQEWKLELLAGFHAEMDKAIEAARRKPFQSTGPEMAAGKTDHN